MNTSQPTGLSGTISTADLPLAQYLVASGYTPTIRVLDGRLCSFEFSSDDTLERLVSAYQRGEALADPRKLKAADYQLRRAIEAARKGGVR
jgi:hypothetical protein